MAKLTEIPIVPTPKTYVLEMNEEEAILINSLLGKTPGWDTVAYNLYVLFQEKGLPSKPVRMDGNGVLRIGE